MKIFSLMDRRNNVRILTVLGVMLMSSVRLMADDFTIDGINYSTTSNTEVTVTGGSVSGALDIPATVTNGDKQYAVTSISSSAFYRNFSITSVHIPGSVRTIGSQAFYDNIYMSSIVIDEGVEKIGSSAFGYNGNGRGANSCSLSLPNSITQIGDYAFQNNGCFNITTLDLPKSLITIGEIAFRNCSSNLEEIIIHSSVTNIGNNAFGDLYSGKLSSVWVLSPSIPETSAGNPFGGYQSNATIHVPSSLLESYQSADYWKDFHEFENCNTHPEYMIPIVVFDRTTWQISISCPNPDATIYFTTDDTTPTISSDTYTSPFFYDGNITLVKAIAVCEGFDDSEVVSLNLDTSSLFLTLTPQPVVTMSSDFTVTMECALPGARFYYHYGEFESWHDENYRISNSTLYDGPFTLPYGTKLSVEAIADGYAPSGWTTVNYYTNYYVEIPYISSEQVIDETYRTVKSKTVTIDYHPNNTYGGTGAYYTIDGSDPNTSATRVEYTGPFTVDRNCTVRAVAFKEGRLNSQIEEHPISDVDSQFKVDGIYYNKAENTIGNCVEVTAGGLHYTGDIVIPETVTDADEITYTVVRIGRNAFNHSNGHDIKSISLPATIESIGEYAFNDCDSITSITLPSGVKSIERYAFYDCNNLEEINLGESLVNLGECAFCNCRNLTSLSLPATLQEIESQAFYDCDGLTTIELPDAIHTIGSYAFTFCDNLTSIVIPEGVTVIPSYCFQHCRSLASVTLPSTLQEIKNYAFHECDALTTIDLPDAVRTLGNYAICNCSNLISVSMPNALTSMGYNVFESCDKLTSIVIPEGVTVIPREAFYNCRSLASVTLPSTLQEIKDYAFYDCDGLTSIELPDAVRTLGNYAICNCSNLISVSMPNALTSMGYNVFESCDKLTSIVIPEGVTVIKFTAFSGCSSLASVILPSTLKTIESSAFYNCSSLNSIILPASLTEIYDNAFNGCSALTAVYSYASNPPVLLNQPHAFTGVLTNANLYVNSEEAVNTYKGAKIWQDFLSVGTVGVLPCAFQLNNCSLSISSQTEGASIYYTRDGSEPTASSTLYEGPIDFLVSGIVRAIAVKDGVSNSPVAVFQQELKVESPVVSIDKDLVITITPAEKPSEKLADVRYYYNYSEDRWNWPVLYSKPEDVIANCTLYTGPVHPLQSGRMRVYALRDGWMVSETDFDYSSDAYYTVSPNINFNGSSREITITHSTEGVVIYYTLDGTDPNTSDSRKVYTEAIILAPNTRVRAVATLKNHFNSSVSEYSDGNWYSFEQNGIYYRITGDTEVSVSGGSVTGALNIPSVVTNGDKQYAVTSIGSSAFYRNFSITSVHIPGSVKTIGSSAFYDNYYMSSIVIDEGVEKIESSAFGYNGNSRGANSCSLSLPNSITQIGDYAFQNNGCFNITTLDLPESLSFIGQGAFRNCSSALEEIVIHGNVAEIQSNSFGGLSNLKSVWVLSSSIPSTTNGDPFNGSQQNATLHVPSSLLESYQSADYWKDFAQKESITGPVIRIDKRTWQIYIEYTNNQSSKIYYTTDGTEPTESSTQYSAPFTYDGVFSVVKAIAVSEGSGTSEVSTLIIDKSTLLTQNPVVTMSSNFTVTMECTLPGARIYYNFDDYTWSSDEDYKISLSTLYEGPFTLPYGTHLYVEAVADGYSGSGWIDVNYYDSYFVESPDISSEQVIDETYRTVKSRTVTIDYRPNNTYGGTGAYYTIDGSDPNTSSTRVQYTKPFTVDRNCTVRAVAYKDGRINSQITEHSIGDVDSQFKVDGIYYNLVENTIGNYVEVTTGGLPYSGDIVIPETVTDAAGNAYTVVRIGRNAFNHSNGHDIKSISLPATIESIGEYAFNDCDSITSITLPSGVKSIEGYAFYDCNNLEEINLGESLVNLGEWAFAYCRKLADLSLPATLQEIKPYTFHDCDGLTALELPDAIHTIGSSAFASCDNLTSIVIPEGVTVISSYCFQYCRSLASVTLPSTLQEIKNYAFHECDALTTIELPDAVSTLGNYAICNCSNLISVSMPNALTSMGYNVFESCDKLTSIAIPEGVTVIPSSAFYNCSSLASVSLPSNVQSIGRQAFENCSNLTSINLPASLTSLEYNVFEQCSKLTSIAIPEGVTDIPSSAFYNCSSLASVTLPSTLKTINSSAFYNCSSLNSIILPASLENIYENAFNGCSALTAVYSYASNPPLLPSTPHAFTGVLTHANLYVNSEEAVNTYKGAKIWQDFLSVGTIGVLPCAFQLNDCSLSISSQTEGASIHYTRDGSEPTASSTLYEGPIDFLVSDTIRAIAVKEGVGNSPVAVFQQELKVESPVVSIDKDLVITITPAEKPSEKLADVRYYYNYSEDRWGWPVSYSKPEDVIANCTLYTEPLHPEKPGRMRVYALRDGWTMSVTEFNYFDGYYLDSPSINWNSETHVFSITHNTSGVVIYYTLDGSDPRTSETRIKYDAPFAVDRNTTLRAVAIKDGTFDAQVAERSVSNVGKQFKVDDIYYTLAENSIGNCVEVTAGGLPYTGDIVIPETVTDADEITYTVVRIGRNAFNHSNASNIKSISLPATIESIGEYAFNDCDSITSITLPSGVKSIEGYAFYNCNNLEEINLGESLVSIGENAFYNCRNLTSLSLPSTLKEIKDYAFRECDALTTIELPDAIHTIGSYAFASCDNLTSIVIPEGVTVIPSHCFQYCRSLASVTLPSTLKEIKDYAFQECDALTTVDLPRTLTSMGQHVFESCDKLTSIAIPEGVTVIPSSAFWSCRSLTSVKLPSTVKEILYGAFYYCENLTTINLPSNVQSIGGQAFYRCSTLTSINLPASLTSLEYNVFEQCQKLTSIVIPEGITVIPSSAFNNCSSLASVTLPATLKTINSSAFYNCSSLNSIILPASLENIYENAFNGCSALTSVYSYASNPPLLPSTPHAFTGVLTNANLYVNSEEAVNTYKGATIWQDFLSVGTVGVLPCAFQFKDYTLSISCQTEGASIHYTRDGSEPTASSTLYEGPIDFLVSDTIRAIAVKEGLGNSPVSVFRQELKVESPMVSIDKDLVITITSAEKPSEKLADVRYYYNYSEDRWNWPVLYSKPEDVIANCTLYTGPVHPLQSGRMRVYALRDGWMVSETDFDYSSDAYYTASPNINASYNGSNYKVTISHNTEGVVIYYTLDGTDPNTSDSRKVYTEAIILAPNTRVRAVATLKNHFNSSVSEYSDGNWYSFEQNGIYYRITGDTEVSVSGGSVTGALDIPAAVMNGEKQYAVTSIGSGAFQSNFSITSVHIPGSVKTIGGSAFYDNYYMSSIVIDEGVEKIESSAFGYNGNSLGANSCSLSLPNSITCIDSYAFQNNGHLNITTLDLPDSLTYIGDGAFRQCSSNVTEIVIKGKVESIGDNAFGSLNNLKSVYVLTPQIPKTVQGGPFNGGQSKVTLYASSSLLESYKTADYWNLLGGFEPYTNPVIRFNTDIWQISMACYNPGSKIYYTTDGTEPSDSSSLYTAPFKYDGNISVFKAVSVCNGENSDVITLTIDKAFVPTPKPTVSLSSDFKVTMECPMPGAKIYYRYNDYSWQDENTRIAESTLYDGPFTLTYGTHIYVEAIADGYTGSGWSDINYYSGYYVSQPDILFEKAADSKSGKVTIDYHPDWSDGGSEAYYTLDGSDPRTSETTRIKYSSPFDIDRNCTVRAVAYKEGRRYSQIREEKYSDIDSQFKVDGIYYNLAENTIGNAVEVTHGALPYVGDIVIPETVTKEDGTQFTVVRIGNNAFSRDYDNEITSISLPATIQSIGDYAFNKCDKLVSIVLPDGVKSIGHEAFSNCYNLEDISLGTSLEYLGENAFASCNKLLSIKLPDTLKSLASGIFQYCNTLTSIAIPEGITVIPSSLFWYCSNLTSVSLPSTLKTIESNAFNNCNNLTSIILPASLTAIYENAFRDCSSLKSVYSLASVPPELRNDPHAFVSILTKATLYVNSEAVSGYKGKKIWQDFLSVKPIDQIPCNPPTFSCENFIMTISCSTPGAVIYYTVDGSNPSKSATRIQYTEPFEFALNGTPLYAIATKDGMKDSDKSVYSRNLVVSNPVIYRDGLKLTITTQTPDAKIYYVVRKDKFKPEWNHDSEGRFNSYDHNAMFGEFHLYEGVTTIPYAGTVYAIAKRNGWENSQCMYLDTGDGMTLETPTISSDEKTRLVTITLNNDNLDDVKCYYTLNDEDPNYSSSRQLYKEPFAIDRNYNIQAIATKEDYFNSSISIDSPDSSEQCNKGVRL